ncbi:radical SAM protein [candidate division KSB1 bacterium]|nr:radical SAM protein [candidate division KSB1 bacterium]
MKKKLLLIQPSPYDDNRQPIKKRKLYFVGLALPLLAALTPDDWDIDICLETIEDVPFDSDADLIGISSMGHGIIRSIDIAREFRQRDKPVIMGGYMASLMPKETKKHCDSVLIGDAEDVWQELLHDASNGSLKPFYQRALSTLKTPLPRYDLVLNKPIGDFLPVQAGRGCPNACSFCSIHCLYRRRYYRRDIAGVMRDIRHVRLLGFKKFLLLDDNIYADPGYMKKLCLEIGRLNMTWMSQCSISIGRNKELLNILADSGCIALSFGLESISKESLHTMDKSWANPDEYQELISAIQEAGIDVSTEMVVGADGDTLESIRATTNFIADTGIILPRFYILTPIPGTDFFKQMQQAQRICNHDIYSYNGSEAVHIPRHMTPEQLTAAYWELYERVFSIRRILGRTLLSRLVLRRPGRQLFYLIANLYYRHLIHRRIAPNIF